VLSSTFVMPCCNRTRKAKDNDKPEQNDKSEQSNKPEQNDRNTANTSPNVFVNQQPLRHPGMSSPPQPEYTVLPRQTASMLTPLPNSIAMVQLSIGASPTYPTGRTPPHHAMAAGANPQVVSYAPPPTTREGKLSVSIDFGTTLSGVVSSICYECLSVCS
jgi:hypothetical protein